MAKIDHNLLHDIIHQDKGGSSSNCPVCKGEVAGDDMMAEAETALKKRYPQTPMDSMIQSYMAEHGLKPKVDAYKGKTVKDVFGSDLKFFSDSGKLKDWIRIIPLGSFKTQAYGEVNITIDALNEMKRHFDEGKRAGVPIDVDHSQQAAVGWVNEVKVMDDGMYAKIDWTKEGSDLLTSKTYRFFSPEFATHYVDPEHSYELDNVLIGGGLVNRPMFKELGAIVANEDGTVKNLTKDNSHVMIFTDQVTDKPLTMNKDLILAKAEADRTEEEKTFLASEQKKETDAKAAVVVTADDKKVTPANDAAISGKEKQIVITADEKARYDSIVSEFHKSNVTKEVEALQFSEDKKGVRITPAQIPALVELVMTFNDDQKTKFMNVMKDLPVKQLFDEKGSDQKMDKNTVADAVTVSASEEMKKAKDAGQVITMGEATKRALTNNPSLANYQENLTAVKSPATI